MNLPNMKDAKVRNKSVVQYIDQENVINKDLYCNKKYYIKTYGCQMNVHDSEEIKAMLDNLGFVETAGIGCVGNIKPLMCQCIYLFVSSLFTITLLAEYQ